MRKIGIYFSALMLLAGCVNAVPENGTTPKAAGKMSIVTKMEHLTVKMPPIVSQFKVDVKKDCGAKGDGITNDTRAFQQAARLIEEKGGGTLVIPVGTYIVGQQKHEPGKYPYYREQPIFQVKGLNGLLIEGNGAILKLASGLRFGAFDKETGAIHNPTLPFTNYDYAAHTGVMLQIGTSRNVIVRNLELDGNSPNVLLGGFWGDTGRQLWSYGLHLFNNRDVHVQNLHTHHHALDGIAIGWARLNESDPPTPHTLVDVNSEYNARQGLSWVGGRGLRVFRSKFNHTGRAINNGTPLVSSPGAGLDIEAEMSVARDGYFEDCEFINNGGAGMVADSGDGGYTKFKNCTFWGTGNWSLWSRKPGLKYEDCKIYGSAVHAVGSTDPDLATQWTRCTFEDKPWIDGKVYRANTNAYLLELNGNLNNVSLKECTFIANTIRSIWASATADGRITFDRCTITHKKADLPDKLFQALSRSANFIGSHFKEEFGPTATTKQWNIVSDNAWIAKDPPTIVDGPQVRYGGTFGPIGILQPSAELKP